MFNGSMFSKLPDLQDLSQFSTSLFNPILYHLLHEDLDSCVLFGCLLDCLCLWSDQLWCKLMNGDIQTFDLNLLIWADSVECICSRYFRCITEMLLVHILKRLVVHLTSEYSTIEIVVKLHTVITVSLVL